MSDEITLREWSDRVAEHALEALCDPPFRQEGSPFAEYDLLGRKQLRRLGVHDYLLMIARIEPARVRRIPATAIAEDGDDDDGGYACVMCPCGARPVVREVLGQCVCERWYVRIEFGVYVTYGKMTPPGVT